MLQRLSAFRLRGRSVCTRRGRRWSLAARMTGVCSRSAWQKGNVGGGQPSPTH